MVADASVQQLLELFEPRERVQIRYIGTQVPVIHAFLLSTHGGRALVV
jgi:hypothetical protein